MIGSGHLRAGYRLKGTKHVLDYVVVLQAERLDELAHPGERARREIALAEARAALENALHPVAKDIRDTLRDSSAARFTSLAIRALCAVAKHVESGDVLSANVFSARYLGGAKELKRVRAGIERMFGPLESLGIRDGGATLLVGGTGTIQVAGSELTLGRLRPYIGLARPLVMEATWTPPADGLLVIENMAAFEAACTHEISGLGEWLFVWSAGYPGRSVRRVVEVAVLLDVPVRVWADLDLDGVRIARLIRSWAGEQWQPWRMSADDIRAAKVRRPLSSKAREAIEKDLRLLPNAPLAETLQTLLEVDATVEQEVFVGLN
jgi:hypothetical protein